MISLRGLRWTPAQIKSARGQCSRAPIRAKHTCAARCVSPGDSNAPCPTFDSSYFVIEGHFKMATIYWQARLVLISHFSAFVFTVVSLLSPAWYFEDPENKIGLWGKCHWRTGCEWMHENRFAWEKRQPEWWIAVQVLMCLAVLTQVLSFIIIFRLNCNDGYVSKLFKGVCFFFLLATFIEILAAVARFGVMANAQRHVVIRKEAHRNFGWAYLLGIMGALMQVFTMLFFTMLVLKQRRKAEDKKQNMSGYGYPTGMAPMMGMQY